MDSAQELRKLPKMDRLLEHASAAGWEERFGREPMLAALRAAVDAARAQVLAGSCCPPFEDIAQVALEELGRASRPTLRRVINATGVCIHTNLGRAPLAAEALEAMASVARGYSNLEYDLDSGERGSRYAHCAELLARVTGAEDGLVVNNCAAAVVLVLSAFARDREVIVSRGQLVEIGGGFRVPDVMRESGARLVEVGTTNRTYARDFAEAITERTAALMLVHRSNFQITGFTHDPTAEELAALARERGVLLIDDLGSGALIDTARYGLAHEPQVQERVAAGADLICFSGDKLLGGPQAGFIVGRRERIAALKRYPLLRALRVDKVTLAGVEATLRLYCRGDAVSRLPLWRAIAQPLERLQERADAWRRALASRSIPAQVVDARSAVGGGSLPGMTLPTRAVAVRAPSLDAVDAQLRAGEPPVVARIDADQLLLDPRTVMPAEDDELIEGVAKALTTT